MLTATHPDKHRHAHLLHTRLPCPSHRHWFSQHRGCLLHQRRSQQIAAKNITSQSSSDDTAPPQQPVGTFEAKAGQKPAPEAPCTKGKGGNEPQLCPCQRAGAWSREVLAVSLQAALSPHSRCLHAYRPPRLSPGHVQGSHLTDLPLRNDAWHIPSQTKAWLPAGPQDVGLFLQLNTKSMLWPSYPFPSQGER